MKVSVCMITYNHENYIAQAIESILNQSTGFQLELVIGEDNSTDGTIAICRDYAKRFPGIIKLVTSDTNVGMTANFYRVYQNCQGKYIAYCEGDDYWIDFNKLQKQVDFLEANPGFSACFHNVMIRYQRSGNDNEWVLHQALSRDTFETEDILGPWFIPSPSIVFVNYADFDLPGWFHHCKYGDLPFMLLLSLRGSFKYFPETMAVYRLHDRGVSTMHKNYDKVILMTYIYESFNIYTKYRFKESIVKAVAYEIDKHIIQPASLEIQENKHAQSPFIKKISGFKKNFSRLFMAGSHS